MSASAPSPRPFGPYVLTHALGTDALGEVWRAGTAGAPRLKPFLLVHTFTAAAIDRSALLSAMETAVNLVDDVQGPTVARGTVMGAIDDIPFLGTLYVEGRTLDHLLAARLLGSPLPVEHGLHIAERLLTALEAGAPVERFTGAAHGFLVPAFVCISNEGEARVFGHGLGAGLLPALKNARMRQTFAPYVAPEVLAEGKPSTAGDLYSAGAILYEALTGRAPPSGVALESVERREPRRGRHTRARGHPPPSSARPAPGPAHEGSPDLDFPKGSFGASVWRPLRALHVQPRLFPAEAFRQGDPAREARAGRRRGDRPGNARGPSCSRIRSRRRAP